MIDQWPVVLQLIVWDDRKTQGIVTRTISHFLQLTDSTVCCDFSLLGNRQYSTNGENVSSERPYRTAGEEEICCGECFNER